MLRRLCRETVAAERTGAITRAQKPRFSVLAICKWLFSMSLRRKGCSTARLTFGLSTALLERSSAALNRLRRPPRLPQM